jgi:hypothetical protein
MTGEIDRKQKVRPENNPWYLLATMYGEPTSDELHARNRRAWNRYMSRWLDKGDRTLLTSRHLPEEITTFSEEELTDFKNAFIARHRQAASTASMQIPKLEADGLIDLSNIDFCCPFWIEGFYFPVE